MVLKKIENYKDEEDFSKFKVLDFMGYNDLSKKLFDEEFEKFKEQYFELSANYNFYSGNTKEEDFEQVFCVKYKEKVFLLRDDGKEEAEIYTQIDFSDKIAESSITIIDDETVYLQVQENIKTYEEKKKQDEMRRKIAHKQKEEAQEKRKQEIIENSQKSREAKKQEKSEENHKDNTNISVVDPTEITPEKIYTRAYERVVAKTFRPNHTNIKFNANQLLKEAGIEPTQEFIDAVMEIHKTAEATS
jgi:hypothetical protein